MYSDDSFFSLNVYGQIGLLILSGALFALMIVLVRAIVTGWPVVVRLMLALVLLWLFIWLSPQVYYTYYSFMMDGLPRKWVIEGPPPLGMTLRVITFTGPADLAHHGQGALGVLLLAAALGRQRDPTGF